MISFNVVAKKIKAHKLPEGAQFPLIYHYQSSSEVEETVSKLSLIIDV